MHSRGHRLTLKSSMYEIKPSINALSPPHSPVSDGTGDRHDQSQRWGQMQWLAVAGSRSNMWMTPKGIHNLNRNGARIVLGKP